MFPLVSNFDEDASDSVDYFDDLLRLDFPRMWQRRRYSLDDVDDDATSRTSRLVHDRDWLARWYDHKLGFPEIVNFNTHI